MPSGFVSGGTADAPIERSDDWLAAQKELEETRLRKVEEARQSDGRSLFEILEANKAAKQEAFEEANKLKNQFRSLDEDEIEFLDSVLESTRAEEERVRRETAEGLELFRRQQEEVDRRGSGGTAVEEGSPKLEEEQWIAAGRKRKRAKEKEGLKGVKLRRSSSTIEQSTEAAKSTPGAEDPVEEDASLKVTADKGSTMKGLKVIDSADQIPAKIVPPTSIQSSDSPDIAVRKASLPIKSGIGLVDYGSDEDDDD